MIIISHERFWNLIVQKLANYFNTYRMLLIAKRENEMFYQYFK